MKTAPSITIDPSILPDHARQELNDFYRFLVVKYTTTRTSRRTAVPPPKRGTAAALASSQVVGIWKDRDLGDSTEFARSLREDAQKREVS